LSLSQLQTVVNNANMVYTYAPVTGIPTASFLFDSNIASNANISISKLNGYPSDSTLFLNGDGLWTIPPTIIPNDSLSLSQLQTVVNNANMVYTYAPVTGIPTASLLFDSNIASNANISISKLNGYPSNGNVYLNGDGLWTIPPTIIPNDSLSLSQLQTVVNNANMVYTYAPVTGIPTASFLFDSNIASNANISISKLNGYPSNGNVYLNGDGLWTIPPTIIPNDSLSLSQLQTVVNNANMVYTYSPVTGIPTASFLFDSNISSNANISISKLN
jgi:Na+-translocating ferredoxin:NAD+ oxidoreductase RnfC subunit